mmetsp:Transcript_41744/g.77265  ORF Transcript_41744/g.77265 Transcript_41744/m.77265 type:complete len:287 (-) Transcript_41744:128-988(-)
MARPRQARAQRRLHPALLRAARQPRRPEAAGGDAGVRGEEASELGGLGVLPRPGAGEQRPKRLPAERGWGIVAERHGPRGVLWGAFEEQAPCWCGARRRAGGGAAVRAQSAGLEPPEGLAGHVRGPTEPTTQAGSSRDFTPSSSSSSSRRRRRRRRRWRWEFEHCDCGDDGILAVDEHAQVHDRTPVLVADGRRVAPPPRQVDPRGRLHFHLTQHLRPRRRTAVGLGGGRRESSSGGGEFGGGVGGRLLCWRLALVTAHELSSGGDGGGDGVSLGLCHDAPAHAHL